MRFGQDRHLHEVAIVHRPVQQRESRRIDHVFRIVEQDHAGGRPHPRFVFAQRAIDAVEAIGLAAGPGAIMDHHPQARIAPRRADHRLHRLRIVAVAADIEPQFRLRPGRQRMVHRGADHFGFPPGRDHHRGNARQRPPRELGAANAGSAQPPAQTPPKIVDIDEDIVECADQKKRTGKQQ